MARKKSLLSKEAKGAIINARQAAKDAKFQKKLAQKAYKEAAKEMRPYLKRLKQYDLRHNLSSGQKAYIKAAWREYEQLTKRPTKVYRTKNKAKLKIAQRASQHEGKVKFDVAFVPTVSQNARVTVKGDTLIISSKYIDEFKIPFNMVNLASDPAKEIQRVINKYPDIKAFVMMAGEFIFNGPVDRDLAFEKVYNHLMRYAPGGSVYEDKNNKLHGPNHHYLNWAFGMQGFKSKNQANINEYSKKYNMTAKGKLKTNKSNQRARARKYGKKF